MNPTEAVENAKKAITDAMAGDLLGPLKDEAVLKKAAKTITAIVEHADQKRIKMVITGGAGSGKTTLANDLSKTLGIPVFDFDEYIEGGWTDDKEEYSKRFSKALFEVWQKLPAKGSWIIEHVEACSPDIIRILHPNFRILLHPGNDSLIATAKAREVVSGDKSDRVSRALQSAKTAEKQFKEAGGGTLKKEKSWTLNYDPKG